MRIRAAISTVFPATGFLAHPSLDLLRNPWSNATNPHRRAAFPTNPPTASPHYCSSASAHSPPSLQPSSPLSPLSPSSGDARAPASPGTYASAGLSHRDPSALINQPVNDLDRIITHGSATPSRTAAASRFRRPAPGPPPPAA
ncbi:hypothetical protein MMC34_006799 [Xylographa carneopallida]|nr:hypothetical protein [Xylographa carneopallida]